MVEDDFEFGIRARAWASVRILPSEVKDLLWAQEQAADLLPYQLPGARRPSLGTVYVRQDVGSDLDEAPADQPAAAKLDERGQLIEAPSAPAVVRMSVRPPSKPMRVVLDGDEHLVITGGPGQGKSTLTLRLTAEIATAWSTRDDGAPPVSEPLLPLRIPARVLATHLGQSISQTLACSASAEYGRYLSGPLAPALFASRVAGCRWLLLIDALDEVADSDARAEIVHTLAAWSAKDAYRVLLTTRPAEGGVLAPLQRAGAVRYELLPFDEKALRRFAAHWFEDDGHTRTFLNQIRDAHLSELVAVPLLATIAAIVFEQHSDRPLPGNKYELYESYLAFIRTSRSTSDAFDLHCTALIEHLGRTTLRANVSLRTVVRDWAHRNQHVGAEEEIIEHLTAVGPIVPRGGDLTFLHHSFAEHVAATADARSLPDEFDPQNAMIAELLHLARPLVAGRFARTVLLHYTHLYPQQADALLGWLHGETAEQHLLAARLLGRHLAASAPVVDEFLKTVRGWAMTTQPRAGLILARTSRATHHPGLAAWLFDLLRNEEAPWGSRAEAAVALALRLRVSSAEEAMSFLRADVEDASASAERRLFAAEALADSGADEREVAERGLRLVLDDPFASGADCRSAAVVLSAFGGKAREHAIAILQHLLTDADTSSSELVVIASGLAEIGVEFHEQCGALFLAVLRDRVHSTDGRRGAAIGLTSLGGTQQASEALAEFITDPRIDLTYRSSAASALAAVGPQQREIAADLLRTQVRSLAQRRQYVTQQSQLCSREDAVRQLRAALADPGATSGNVIAAAGALATLGPAFHDEADQHLQRVLLNCSRNHRDFVSSLRSMAELNEPHRAKAVAWMRRALIDLGVPPGNRCSIAQELIRCGPEYHAEAAEELLRIACSERDVDAVANAWSCLADLRPALSERARAEMLALAGGSGADNQLSILGSEFRSADEVDRRAAAKVLVFMLGDDRRTVRERLQAGQGLLNLGDSYHRTAVDGVVALVRAGVVLDFDYVARVFASTGRGVRDSLAQSFFEILREEPLDPFLAMPAVSALGILGQDVPTEPLFRIISCLDFELDERARAAVMLARSDHAHIEEAANLVFRACGSMDVERWRLLVMQVAGMGVDVQWRLRALASDRDRRRTEVTAAACLLGTEGIPFLRGQIDDPYVQFQTRSRVYQTLLEVADPAVRTEAVALHLEVLRDSDEPVYVRCAAATGLASFDSSYLSEVTEVLWRWAESIQMDIVERAWAAEALTSVDLPRSSRLVRLIIEIVRDPGITDELSVRLTQRLPRVHRTNLERFLLANQAADAAYRLPHADVWDDIPLRDEAEELIRDLLSAPEAYAEDRRAAAAGLSRLSVRRVPESIGLLLAEGTKAALEEAATHGAAEFLHSRARETVLDDSLPIRERRQAALLIGKISDESSVREFLMSDRESPWPVRIEELRLARAFGDLRAIRDDPSRPPAQRFRAVEALLTQSTDDLAACAGVLNEIAAEPEVVPALRWRAAKALLGLGPAGRSEGLRLLEAIAHDGELPVNTRSEAAIAICSASPTRRPSMRVVLRELLPIATPLQRLCVLHNLGFWWPDEGLPLLREMAADTSLAPMVRVRAAINLIGLSRDERAFSALVVKEVANDPSVPRYMRALAACGLARWSVECRDEARALLIRLREKCPE